MVRRRIISAVFVSSFEYTIVRTVTLTSEMDFLVILGSLVILDMARCYLWLFSLCVVRFRLAGDHLYGKLLFTWLSLVMSMMVSFCAVLFPTRCLG